MSDTCEIRRLRGNFAEGRLASNCDGAIEPWNTWSNVAYVIGAIVVAVRRPELMGWLLTAAMVLLGVGSGLYHYFKRGWSNRVDVSGMYATMSAIGFATWPIQADWWAAIAVFCTGVITALYAHVLWKRWDTTKVMAVTLLVGTAGLIASGSWLTLAVSWGCYAIGYAFWTIDQRTTWLGRYGHAMWHVFTAVAMTVMPLGIR